MTEIQLTLLSEEPLVRVSQSQDCEKDSMTPVATLPSVSFQWLSSISQNSLSGKTFPEFCHPTEEGILVPSSQRWGTSGMGGPTECLTLNTLESPNDVVESSLSDILVEIQDVPERYLLSPKACEGILRRAESRGKKLPPVLKAALTRRVTHGQQQSQEP